MLDYGTLRNVFKNSSRINSEHLVLAEWNMNKYSTISQYGVYINNPPLSASYNPSDPNIASGENYLIYDDGSTKRTNDQEFFSELSTAFRPNRPDPGIILMQKYKNNLITTNASALRTKNVNPYVPRYYAFSEFRKYDYWNSAKNFQGASGEISGGMSNPETGNYQGVHPFVVYEDIFPCNKITIKVQNHISIPIQFSIEILQQTSASAYTWVTAYSQQQSSSADFASGELNIYFNQNTQSWVKVSKNTNIGTYVIDDLASLDDESSTEFKLIKGIRFVVNKMSIVTAGGTRYPASLELLEISPRLEANLSNYTESFTFNTTLGDNTSFGLPIGSIVSSNGNISISNDGGIFLYSGKLSQLNMLSPDVKFMFYQIVNDGVSDKAVPLKVLYSRDWTVTEDYSAQVNLEDGFKFLRETSAPDLLLHSTYGQPLSIVILFLLDNVGITDYVFEKTDNNSDAEDVLIRSFFCKKEQTVAEVMEELAVATQCAVYFDPIGKLHVMTKERLTKSVSMQQSASSTIGTDFWMILDEDYTKPGGGNVIEYSSASAYTANVVSYAETQLNPVTDGDIIYHLYGPPKVPALDEIPKNVLDDLIEGTVFPASLAFFNLSYNTRIIWNVADNTEDATMGAANLVADLTGNKLQNIFTSTYTAENEDQAVRLMYLNGNTTQRNSLIIQLDKNEGLTINPFKGMVLIGTEYIKYNGKLLRFSSPLNNLSYNKIIFTREEYNQEVRNLAPGSSITLIGLVVDVQFKIVETKGDKYEYRIIGDGRGKLGSEIQFHKAFTEDQTGLSESLRYGITLGGAVGSNNFKPSIAVKNNFLQRIKYKSAYRKLKERGITLNPNLTDSYLGFLKIAGRVNTKDKELYQKFYGIDAGEGGNFDAIVKEVDALNKQTDAKVPGNFDEYVLYEGERNIYGQRINVGFKPNIISTRMRLYSPRRSNKNDSWTAETVSSIAGIAFGVNQYGEGYYLEVEGVGSGKQDINKESFRNNLRFYKVFRNKNGAYEPKLLISAPVAAWTVENVDVQVLKGIDATVDPFFDLSIVVDYPKNGSRARYTIRYGDTRIGRYVEEEDQAIDGSTVSLFVRGDSQAIFEYVCAAARPIGLGDISLFKGFSKIDEKVKAGILPINEQYLYKDDQYTYYFNDFAKLVREVKDFDIRFQFPAYISKLIDVSEVNSQYMIKKYTPTPFGAKLIAVNTSPGPILLTTDSNNPLYVSAVAMEELSSGTVSMDAFIDRIEEKKTKVIDREKNKSIYGSQTFTIDSQYLQTLPQAQRMMQWIIRYCSRPRIKLSMEVFPNPLLELGDKVKIYDKSRGYYADNKRFGDKTFVVSSINYSVSGNGPSMNVEISEVGEA